MRFIVAACLYGLITGAAAAAGPHWIRIRSANFEIYSTGSESSTRDTLKQFEQVRAFFTSTLPTKDDTPLPVRIIAFNSVKAYEPYRLNEFATAYYYPGAERDMIVMSHGGVENFPTAIHEYVHLMLTHAGVQAPPWLDEGLAEFYSTLHQLGNRVVIGEIIPGRLAELRKEKWVSLAAILAAGRNSPFYNEKNKAGSLYNEGWALTHMLSLSPAYRPKWVQFARAVLEGQHSVEALTATYGKPLETIEDDLRSYVRGNRFLAGTFDGQLEKVIQPFSAEPAPPFDVKLMLLDLAGRPGQERETNEIQRQLEKLSAEVPTRPEPHVQLGYLSWRRGETQEAQRQFEKAFALGGRSAKMLWDYGRMIESSHPEDTVRILNELIALEPARRDVRIELANALLNAGRASDAVEAILALGRCEPEAAARCVSIAMYAYLKLNDRENAVDAAQLYLKFAKSPEDRQRALKVLDFLQVSPEMSVSGSLVELVCGDIAKVVLETPAGKKTFVIEDPKNISATGHAEDGAKLSCGPQKPAPVRLDYTRTSSGESDGAVRMIHFNP